MIDNKFIDFIFTFIWLKFKIERKYILAIIQNGSSTVPILQDSMRDLDFIVVINDKRQIKQEFIKCFSVSKHKTLEFNVVNYSELTRQVESSSWRALANYCFNKVIYKTVLDIALPLPLDKDDPQIISHIYKELQDIIINGNTVKCNKYFYWFLYWAQTQGFKITDKEIITAHDNNESIDTKKYLWLLTEIKKKYNL